MNRQEYNECMRPHMKGEGRTKEERQRAMCIGAKLCTKKASTAEEAERLCNEPKAPKPIKAKGKKVQTCEKQVLSLSHCIAERIDMELAHNINSVETAIINAMMECQCSG